MDIKIDVNLGGAFAALDQLQADIRDRAAVSAVNKTLAKGSTAMNRAITREFNVTAAYVRERLKIKRARFEAGSALISGELFASSRRGRSANLIHFVEKVVSLAQAKRRMKAGEGGTYQLRNGATVTKALQLRFKIKRAGPPKTIKGAFIGNNGRTVFIREGASRLPIKALSTIDVEQMFNTKRLNQVVRRAMEQDFRSIFANELRFYTERFNRRAA
jgi:autotransporter adhesin